MLDELLEARGWSKRVLGVVIGMDESSVGKIVAGRKPVDAHLALVLGEVFGIEAERFVELQRSYDLAQARIVAKPDPARTRRAHLFGDLPVSDMIKRRWIEAEDVRDVAAVERSLARFFGVSSPNEIEVLPHAAKKTHVSGPATPEQIAWLYRVKQLAADTPVPKFSESSAPDAVRRLGPLRIAAEEARKVPRMMAECGIRFVIVESLARAKIDGVCLWLTAEQPVIGLSMRHDRIDNFWFVLRHELEHVIQGHGKSAVMLDIDMEGIRPEAEADEERIANEAAAEFCVPQEALGDLIARKSPFFADRDIVEFARTVGVHPGLVAGQLQRKTGRYDRFRAHQVKIRSLVTAESIVDGWGDVAPLD
ncbi:MAG TPA: ImmA/IrrE family metallo-endopeptidase [Kofleriaceae bacterium]|nr:ImmA/IrrE family metallo-endopeptidase [Kofleriaceae bacterium]